MLPYPFSEIAPRRFLRASACVLLCVSGLGSVACGGKTGAENPAVDAGRELPPPTAHDAATPTADANTGDGDGDAQTTVDASTPVPDAGHMPPPQPPFGIVANGQAVDIVVDAADEPAVLRAVGDLQADVQRVSSVLPAVKNSTDGLSGNVILIGTVGKSAIIDTLVSSGLLSVDKIQGKREAFIIRTVDNPVPGVARALVIAGSDRRGTIYGIYDTSEAIGVSPWYDWADVTPIHQDTVSVSGDARGHGESSFKYRGIFINDEENFVAWAGSLDPGKAPGPETYKKIFELLLRLRANLLWPAMHKISKEFSRYPENMANAERYGIVIGAGTMMRTDAKEWDPWATAHLVNNAKPEYDYTKFPDVVYDYWDTRAKEITKSECAFGVGMRGFNDTPINAGDASSVAEKVALMKTIFADQQRIISTRAHAVDRPATQFFLPYKEVLDLYNAGLEVPEDVTLVWPEDNHGFVRQLPNDKERARSGGSGVYYHLSYWGPPGQSYLWINSTPLSTVREELRKTYDSGARDTLVVNVGDIKPAEIGAEFVLRLGYTAEDFASDDVRAFVTQLATRDFGPEHADEIADIVTRYFQINIARRPEFMKKGIYSLVSYGDEAQRRADELAALVTQAEAISKNLPSERVDAFYEMVLYPLRASKFTFDKYNAADRTDLYAAQGRRKSVTKYRAAAQTAYDTIVADIAHYNTKVAGGKWNKILNPFNTQQPTIEALPKLTDVPAAASGDPLGVVIDGETKEGGKLEFSGYTRDTRFIDVFTKSDASIDWTATASAAWLKLSKANGTIVDEQRLWVSIDWSTVPSGESSGTIKIASKTATKTVSVRVSNPAVPARSKLDGYVEANGYVAIEAEHFSSSAKRGGSEWHVLRDLGRNGDSVKALPDLASSVTSDIATKAPSLDYKIYFFSTGTFPVTIYRLPTLNAAGATRVAIAIDDGEPQIIAGANVTQSTAWRKAIIEQIDQLTANIQVTKPGYHTLHLYQVDPAIVVDRLVIDTGGIQPSYLGPPESYHH